MIVALNNKSNLDKEEFDQYKKKLLKLSTTNQLILCPTLLNISGSNLDNISLGAQNVSCYSSGAHTGEVSASQLKSFNVEYCIVGHSERRQEQHETNKDIALKTKNLLDNDIVPILCIGETLEERQNNKVEKVLQEEIKEVISTLTSPEKEKLIVAYEPIWSIGTGIIPSNQEIEEVFKLIKTILPNNKILYGGSANEKNISVLKECKVIDGYLLGGLSLKPDLLSVFLEQL